MFCKRKHIGNYAAYARDREYGGADELNAKLKVEVFTHLAESKGSVIYRKNLKGHCGCVNAIEFSRDNGRLIASGGDDKEVLLWNTHQALSGIGKPVSMNTMHQSNIFCLAFDNENKTVISGGNDANVIIHDLESKNSTQMYLHEDVVYGLSVDPWNSNLVGTAGDDGRILIIDIRLPQNENQTVLATSQNPMQGLRHNPMDPRLIASANSGDGTTLWDIRKPKCPLKNYANKIVKHSDMVMNVTFDSTGKMLASLRKWSGPVIYDMFDQEVAIEFENPGYLNSCTMKSCTFAGQNDEYIISGSDDFNLYVWKLPDQKSDEGKSLQVKDTHCILRGHRSIVNQVRYNPECCLIISSGVEKIIKVWSPFPIGDGSESSRSESSRAKYTGFPPYSSTARAPDSPTAEDPIMLAFFDELIRRERLGDNSAPLEWYMSTAYEDQNSISSSEEQGASSTMEDQEDLLDCSTTSDSEMTSTDNDYIEDESDFQHSDDHLDSTDDKNSDADRNADRSCDGRHLRAELANRKRPPTESSENYLQTHWKKKRMGAASSECQNDLHFQPHSSFNGACVNPRNEGTRNQHFTIGASNSIHPGESGARNKDGENGETSGDESSSR